MAKISEARKQDCREKLLSIVKPGDVVYTKLNHVSRSGMMRHISLYIISASENSEGKPYPLCIDYWAAPLVGTTISEKNGGLKMGGCGMDMGFQAVYCLGSALWPNGTPEPHGVRNREPDSAGGYALKHRWL